MECLVDCEQLELPGRVLMSKEELQESSSCRLCGLGASLKAETPGASFLPLFELAQTLHQHLNVLINRYLPIKVFESDEYFPRFVCSVCVGDLEQTVHFFDRLATGQRLLLQVIQAQPPQLQPQPLSFSAENPVCLATPRKRGRPKKDPSQLKPKPALPLEDTGKPRRSIRAPGRYGCVDPMQSSTTEADANAESDPGFVAPLAKPSLGQPPVKQAQLKANTNHGSVDPLGSVGEQTEFRSPNSHSSNVLVDSGRLIDHMHGPEDAEDAGFFSVKAETQEDDTSGMVVAGADADPLGDDPKDLDFVVQGNKVKQRKLKRGRGRPRKKGRKAKSKKAIACPQCDKVFGHPSSLRYHRLTAHAAPNATTFSCELCQRVFKHKNLLKCHMLAHSDTRDFCCEHCPKAFKSRASLETHVRVIHVGVKYECEECGLLLSFKSSLVAHMRLHRGEKPFVCDFCHKAFTQKSNLDEHLRVHTNARPYNCSICFKTFKTASQRRSHKLTHATEKSLLCSTCGKSFRNDMQFKYHLRRHAGEKPVECLLCNRRFVEPNALAKHMRTHTGAQSYHCSICNRNFADGSNLRKHMKRHDSDSSGTGTQRRLSAAGTAPVRPAPRPPKLQGRVLQLLNKSTLQASSEEGSEAEAASAELQGQVVEFFVRPSGSQGSSNTRSRRFLKNSALSVEQMRESFSQGMGTGDPDTDNARLHGAEVLGEEEEGSLVQILDSEGLLEGEDGQVIYVYPDDLPIFTITLNGDHQAIQVRGSGTEETTLQTLEQLSGGPLTFTTVDGTELGTQYFNLQPVDDSAQSNMSLGPILIPHSSEAGEALSPSSP